MAYEIGKYEDVLFAANLLVKLLTYFILIPPTQQQQKTTIIRTHTQKTLLKCVTMMCVFTTHHKNYSLY